MKKLLSAVFLMLFSFTFSQTKTQKIQELLNLTLSSYNDVILAETFIGEFKKIYPNVSEEFWKNFSKNNIKSQELQNLIIPIYDKYYTDSDLDGLLHFYRSDIGKKIITNLPIITAESKEVGEKWGRRIGEKLILELEEKTQYKSPPPPMRK